MKPEQTIRTPHLFWRNMNILVGDPAQCLAPALRPVRANLRITSHDALFCGLMGLTGKAMRDVLQAGTCITRRVERGLPVERPMAVSQVLPASRAAEGRRTTSKSLGMEHVRLGRDGLHALPLVSVRDRSPLGLSKRIRSSRVGDLRRHGMRFRVHSPRCARRSIR
jgi:hypothetical protein